MNKGMRDETQRQRKEEEDKINWSPGSGRTCGCLDAQSFSGKRRRANREQNSATINEIAPPSREPPEITSAVLFGVSHDAHGQTLRMCYGVQWQTSLAAFTRTENQDVCFRCLARLGGRFHFQTIE